MKIDRNIAHQNIENFEIDQEIFREGSFGREMYIILYGEVEIVKKTRGMMSKRLIVLHKGDIFGEMAIIEKKSRSASARAITATSLLKMDEALFYSMVKRNPDFALKMIKILSARLRSTNLVLQDVMSQGKNIQIIDGLRDYALRLGQKGYKGTSVSVEDFVVWSQEHLGIPADEVRSVIQLLKQRRIVKPSVIGNSEILLDKSFFIGYTGS